jgi:hypothetical protein
MLADVPELRLKGLVMCLTLQLLFNDLWAETSFGELAKCFG